jgi:HAD superfamily hydrolase (TIGR01509 family)
MAAFESMGVRSRDASDIRATIGLPLEQAFSKLLGIPLDNNRVAQGVQQYQLAFRNIVLPRARQLVFPGVADGLAALRRQGVTVALATSKFYASADALLQSAALRDHFGIVLGADQVTHPKPHPEMGQVILERLGATPEDAVVVGDTTHDVLMARAAGMRSVAVTYGVHSREELMSAEPSWVADSFDDVLSCIGEGLQQS